MIENYNEFGKRLQKVMDSKGYKAAQVVELSKKYDESGKGISKPSLSQWLNGTYIPKQNGLYLLSKVLDVSPSFLMGKTDDPTYDLKKLNQEEELCDLMKKCYGKQAYQIVKMYLSLNEEGKEAAFLRIQELTELERYKVKRASMKIG